MDTENIGSLKKNTVPMEKLVDALLHSYQSVMNERKKQGNTWKGLSRKEYQSHKRDDDPDYWTIERIIGSWNDFTKIVPDSGRREKIPFDQRNPDNFRRALLEISEWMDNDPSKVSAQHYNMYLKEYPGRFRDWRTYAKELGVTTWKQARDHVLST